MNYNRSTHSSLFILFMRYAGVVANNDTNLRDCTQQAWSVHSFLLKYPSFISSLNCFFQTSRVTHSSILCSYSVIIGDGNTTLSTELLGDASVTLWKPINATDWTRGLFGFNVDIATTWAYAGLCEKSFNNMEFAINVVCINGSDTINVIVQPTSSDYCFFEIVVDSSVVCNYANSVHTKTCNSNLSYQQLNVPYDLIQSEMLSGFVNRTVSYNGSRADPYYYIQPCGKT